MAPKFTSAAIVDRYNAQGQQLGSRWVNVVSSPNECHPNEIHLAARGLTFDGSAAGSVRRDTLEHAPTSGPVQVRVSWKSGRILHDIVFTLKGTACITTPTATTVSVDVLLTNPIQPSSGAQPNPDETWSWRGTGGIVHAFVLETAHYQRADKSTHVEVFSLDVLCTRALGGRTIIDIPNWATELEYYAYPTQAMQVTIDGVNVAPIVPAVNPFYLRIANAGSFLPGAPIPIAQRVLLDRSAMSIACHQDADDDTRALLNFTIQT